MVKQEVKDEDGNGVLHQDVRRNVSLHPAMSEQVISEIKQEVETDSTYQTMYVKREVEDNCYNLKTSNNMATKQVNIIYSPYLPQPIEIMPEIEKCYFNPESGSGGFSTQCHQRHKSPEGNIPETRATGANTCIGRRQCGAT